eukprot:SAG11_NODE_349_length_10401_cov_22.873423_3_plen_70_part_00
MMQLQLLKCTTGPLRRRLPGAAGGRTGLLTPNAGYTIIDILSPDSIHLDLTALYWSSGAIAQNWLQRFG